MHGIIVPRSSKRCQPTQKCDRFLLLRHRKSKMLTRQLRDNWETGVKIEKVDVFLGHTRSSQPFVKRSRNSRTRMEIWSFPDYPRQL